MCTYFFVFGCGVVWCGVGWGGVVAGCWGGAVVERWWGGGGAVVGRWWGGAGWDGEEEESIIPVYEWFSTTTHRNAQQRNAQRNATRTGMVRLPTGVKG